MALGVLMLMLVIPASLAQEDLEGKIFFFPTQTNTAHVILRPNITKPLQKVSACLNTYSELSREYALISYATSKSADAFLIMYQPQIEYRVYINGGGVVFKTEPEPLDWRHTCVTWDSETGIVQLYVNGKFYPGGVVMKGSSIAVESRIILGQDQDSFAGGLDAVQSLVGEISDVHMWDYVLTPEDVQKVISGDLHGNLFNWKSPLYEIRGEVLVKPKNRHLDSKVFVFPKETNTAHVILRPPTTKSLQKVSVCLRSYTDLQRIYPLFSLATPGKDNAFLITFQPPNIYNVYINQEGITIKTDSDSLDWRHTCVTWDSNTGVVQLWVNGKLYPRKVCMKGSSIAAESSIVLGQEQDSFGEGFDASQSLVGEISDVNMWDYVLTSRDVQKVISGYLYGNFINWKSLLHEMKGEVVIQLKP
ncbi:C-reactive protein-like [Mantella aurantiaca]